MALTITKGMRMETKEGNEGKGFHISVRKSTRNLKNVIFEQFAWSNFKK
jgi:hypothetical protein